MNFFGLFIGLCVLVVNAEREHDSNKEIHHPHDRLHQQKIQHERAHHEKSSHGKVAHEKANLHHTANRHKNLVQKHHSGSRKHNFKDRSQSTATTRPSNDSDHSSILRVHYNGDAGLLGMLNETDSKALILDYSLNVALLDGQTGSCLIKDHGRKKDYVLPPNSTWTQSTTTFDDFFRSLNSLQPILTLGMQNGTEFSSANTSQPIPEAARRNLSRLGLTNQDLEMFSSALNGSLGWMYRGRGSFNVRNGLRWFVMMNLAFNTWFENPQAQEVLRSLEPLDLGAIFGANTCVEALINLFSQLANRTDIAGVITGKNREPENFLRLAEYAIGVSNDGVDGLLTVMTEVVLVLLGNGSFPGVLEAYLLYRPDPSVNLGTLRGLAEQVEGVIQEQDRRYNNTVRNNIGWLDEDVANCLNNNCVLNGVNLTDVAAFLTAKSWPEAAGALGRIIGRLLGSPDDFFEFSNAALSNVRPSNLPQIIAGFHKDIPQVIATLIKNAAPSQLISNFIRFVSDLPQAVFRFIGATVGNLNFPRTIAEFSARLTSLWSNVQRALKSVVANATPGKFFSDMIELAVSVSRSILQMLPAPLLNLYNYTTNFLFGGSDPKYIVDDLVWTFRNVSGDLILSLPEPLRGLVNATSTVLTTVLCGSDPAQIIADVSGTIKNWTSGLASFSPIPLGDLGNVTALWSTASNLPFVGPFLSAVAGPKSQQIRADLGDTVQSLVRRFFDSPVGRVLRDLLLTVVSVVTQLVDGLVGLVTGGSSSPTVGSPITGGLPQLPQTILGSGSPITGGLPQLPQTILGSGSPITGGLPQLPQSILGSGLPITGGLLELPQSILGSGSPTASTGVPQLPQTILGSGSPITGGLPQLPQSILGSGSPITGVLPQLPHTILGSVGIKPLNLLGRNVHSHTHNMHQAHHEKGRASNLKPEEERKKKQHDRHHA